MNTQHFCFVWSRSAENFFIRFIFRLPEVSECISRCSCGLKAPCLAHVIALNTIEHYFFYCPVPEEIWGWVGRGQHEAKRMSGITSFIAMHYDLHNFQKWDLYTSFPTRLLTHCACGLLFLVTCACASVHTGSLINRPFSEINTSFWLEKEMTVDKNIEDQTCFPYHCYTIHSRFTIACGYGSSTMAS